MRKKRIYLAVALLIFLFGAGVWQFVGSVSSQLWNASIRTIIESTHQGAKALNLRIESDFDVLASIWNGIADAEDSEEILRKHGVVEPDVRLYLGGQNGSGDISELLDETVYTFLNGNDAEWGLLDVHKSSVTGENVFDIYVRGMLADGTAAYLVKEYRAKAVAEQFTLSFYDNSGFSYLVNSRGTIMVHPSHKNGNQAVHNLFDMISGQGNDSDKMAKFTENIQEQKTGWERFSYEGKVMMFCYEPLHANSDWLLVSIIPEHVIQAQTTSILQGTLIFSGIVVGVILMIVAVFVGMKMHENKIHTCELQAAFDLADNANKAKGRFLMDMSHDIRTPLNAILGMTAVAKQNVLDQGRLEDCLKKIEVSGTQLLSLVSDVLDMSQIEQGRLILKEEKVCLPHLFEETANLMRGMAEEAGLVMECAPVELKDENVTGDPMRIRQILLNIISNAVKYTPVGGRVSLELSETEKDKDGYGTYRFCCADTGIGMDEEFQKKMFLPFERAKNTTSSKISGIGAGLAITKSLLDMMGGNISVKSVLGQGSTFIIEFRFPIQESIQEQDEDESEEIWDVDYGTKRVLIVEDNELNMEIMEEILSVMGVLVETAVDGQIAVDMVKDHPVCYYDLIFMDIQMPVMNGYEATRRIRRLEQDKTVRIPIFAVSANALAEDEKNALDSGMDGHIAKPVDPDFVGKVLKQCFQ